MTSLPVLRARDKPSQGFASYTRNIANVTATDPYTVVIETKAPDPILLNSVSRIRIISAIARRLRSRIRQRQVCDRDRSLFLRLLFARQQPDLEAQ